MSSRAVGATSGNLSSHSTASTARIRGFRQPQLLELVARFDPIEIGVDQWNPSRVLVHEREGRAGDVTIANTEPARQPLHEGGLPGPQGTVKADHIADSQDPAEPLGNGLQRVGGGGGEDDGGAHP